MSQHRHIILIGMRGSGKTSVGRLLAARLKRPFIDLDDLTPGLLGAPSVAAAFTQHGEAAFRQAERRALEGVLDHPPAIIALGGGTPTAPGAAGRLESARAAGACTIVYLRGTAALLRSRLDSADNAHRPALTPLGTLAEIEHVLAARDPLYLQLTDHAVELDANVSPEQTVERLARLLD